MMMVTTMMMITTMMMVATIMTMYPLPPTITPLMRVLQLVRSHRLMDSLACRILEVSDAEQQP